MKELERIVKGLLKERLGGDVVVEQVRVLESFDQDGDPVLQVRVIFDSKDGMIDGKRLKGIVRHLRPKFAEVDERRFPLISYISKSDYERQQTEAA